MHICYCEHFCMYCICFVLQSVQLLSDNKPGRTSFDKEKVSASVTTILNLNTDSTRKQTHCTWDMQFKPLCVHHRISTTRVQQSHIQYKFLHGLLSPLKQIQGQYLKTSHNQCHNSKYNTLKPLPKIIIHNLLSLCTRTCKTDKSCHNLTNKCAKKGQTFK
jgi:hypothetical protein